MLLLHSVVSIEGYRRRRVVNDNGVGKTKKKRLESVGKRAYVASIDRTKTGELDSKTFPQTYDSDDGIAEAVDRCCRLQELIPAALQLFFRIGPAGFGRLANLSTAVTLLGHNSESHLRLVGCGARGSPSPKTWYLELKLVRMTQWRYETMPRKSLL